MIVASLNDYWKLLKLDLLFAPDPVKEPNLLRISDSESELTDTNDQTEEPVEANTEAETKPPEEHDGNYTLHDFSDCYRIFIVLINTFRNRPAIDTSLFTKTHRRNAIPFGDQRQ